MLIDGDLRNPAVHRLFDVRPGPGLSELLRGESQLPEVLRPTADSRVARADRRDLQRGEPCRGCPGTTWAESSPNSRSRIDCIILDSSPVLPVTDSLLLARHVDGVVFSVLQNVSTLPAIDEAYRCLASLNVVLLGAVVSGTRPDVASYGRRRYLPCRRRASDAYFGG